MTASTTKLHLHEEIMLLAFKDEQGTVASNNWYTHAVGGALLAELLMAGRIEVDDDKKKLVNVVSTKPVGEPILDEALQRIATANRRASAQNWVSRLANMKQLKHRIAAGLCKRGILREDEDRILILFRRRIYPEINPVPERRLIERLRKAIFNDAQQVDPRTAVLISLANAADLLKVPFGRKNIRSRKKRIEQINKGLLIGNATHDAVQAAVQAIAISAVMPAVIIS